MHIYISSQTLSRTSGTNVAARAVTALIAFKHTFILIIHLFSGILLYAHVWAGKKMLIKEPNRVVQLEDKVSILLIQYSRKKLWKIKLNHTINWEFFRLNSGKLCLTIKLDKTAFLIGLLIEINILISDQLINPAWNKNEQE